MAAHRAAPTESAPPRRRRAGLSRERVLREALRLVDDEGLGALTMRRLGSRLGVEAVSLYNHIDGKPGLHAGIVDLLWEEVERSAPGNERWKDSLRSLARRLRAVASDHPEAFPLLMSATSFAAPMLRTVGRDLAVLRDAGFDDARAAKTLNAVVGYAVGYAAMQISCFATRPDPGEGADELESLITFMRALPPNTPADFVRVARDCCMCDVDEQFEFGLEALLAGLDPGCDALGG